MDEDKNNFNEPSEQPPKENPFKNGNFYAAYFITIFILGVISFLLTGVEGEYWVLGVLFLCIPFSIVGVIVWLTLRVKNRPMALGILFGSITPFIVVFIVTGGCGLFVF